MWRLITFLTCANLSPAWKSTFHNRIMCNTPTDLPAKNPAGTFDTEHRGIQNANPIHQLTQPPSGQSKIFRKQQTAATGIRQTFYHQNGSNPSPLIALLATESETFINFQVSQAPPKRITTRRGSRQVARVLTIQNEIFHDTLGKMLCLMKYISLPGLLGVGSWVQSEILRGPWRSCLRRIRHGNRRKSKKR